MNGNWHIKTILLGILSCMSSISFGGIKTDSFLFHHVFYYEKYHPIEGTDSIRYIYLKHHVDVLRRNASLIPTLVSNMTPDIYGTELIDDNLLSPLNKDNT